MSLSQDFFIRLVAIFGLFLGISVTIFWIGIVWWVGQDVFARSKDKIIVAASVAICALLGPVGLLLYMVIRPKQTIQEANIEVMEREMLLHASATTICPTCNRMAQQDFLACPYCGTQLKYHCPSCQKMVELDWEHCPYCGQGLGHNPPPLGQAAPVALAQPASLPSSPTALSNPQPATPSRPSRPRRRRPSVVKTIAAGLGRAVVAIWHGLDNLSAALVRQLGHVGRLTTSATTASSRKLASAATRAANSTRASLDARSKSQTVRSQSTTVTSTAKAASASPAPATPQPAVASTAPTAEAGLQFGATPSSFSSPKSDRQPTRKTKKQEELDRIINDAKAKKATRHRA